MNTQKIDQVSGDALKTAMSNVDRDLTTAVPVAVATLPSDYRPPAFRIPNSGAAGIDHANVTHGTDIKAVAATEDAIAQLITKRDAAMSEAQKHMEAVAFLNHEIMVANNIRASRHLAASMLEFGLGFSKAK